MLVGLLLAVSAHAAHWSAPVATRSDGAESACSVEAHRVSVPVELSSAGLVFVELSEWDVPMVVGLTDGPRVCHARLETPPLGQPEGDGSRSVARWLPAGDHAVEVAAGVPGSAVLTVSVVTPADLVAVGMPPALATAALTAADHAWTDGHALRPALAVLDFSQSSTEERFWLVDLATGSLRHRAFVSHGKGSGHRVHRDRAVRFSNEPFSNQTSLGLFRASETYTGDHGRSLRLDGLEPGVNDLARDRAIVLHGAKYARVDHIAEWGYLGRSHGCPALDDRIVQSIIDDLHDGGLIYAWGGVHSSRCCTLRAGTEASPDAPYLPDPLGLVSIY
ncbi:MAG: hypothetical protein CL927_00160 [Deltaproteobacteria bacterium]|nr:hypothetical protein [Deltaproteobacteria bacterium]HCH62852.1 hypothetical protein [Deltaproteobacteria bacterium]